MLSAFLFTARAGISCYLCQCTKLLRILAGQFEKGFIACVDGLKGFPKAIEAVYPRAAVQLCVVHMVRHSLNYVSWKMRSNRPVTTVFPS